MAESEDWQNVANEVIRFVEEDLAVCLSSCDDDEDDTAIVYLGALTSPSTLLLPSASSEPQRPRKKLSSR